MGEEGGVEVLRAAADAVQALVREGRYPEAMAQLTELHAVWSERLGPDHEDVKELLLDRETVASMAGVSAFGASMGFRWSGLPVKP